MTMTKITIAAALATSVIGTTLTAGRVADPKPGIDWPSFRGVRAGGVADGFPTPTTWDVPKNQNVRWKTPIDGLGHSSPIIWGDRLCVSTAVSGKADASLRPGLYGDVSSVNDDTVHTWKLVCLDKKTGRVTLDRTILTAVPKIKRHLKSTHANTTLATDGTHLVAMLGSEGLYAFDMAGTQLWKQDLGVLDAGWYMDPGAQWEFSSSPVIHDGIVVILADVQKNSFLATFDVKTGKQLWRIERRDVPTFGSPTIHQVGATTEILVNGWHHTGAYDFKTGKEIWMLDGGGDIPVPTPIASNGFVYTTNAHGGPRPVFAVRETATGNVSLKAGETSNAQVVWSVPSGGSYMATPIAYGDLLYVCAWDGGLTVFDAKTGARAYQQRLGEGTAAFTASVVAGDGKVYFTNEDGDVYVVKAGRAFEQIAKNPLGEVVMATPAISEGVLYFRTAKNIIAIGGR
jgi:outer membrane protein assembly factor BamB